MYAKQTVHTLKIFINTTTLKYMRYCKSVNPSAISTLLLHISNFCRTEDSDFHY